MRRGSVGKTLFRQIYRKFGNPHANKLLLHKRMPNANWSRLGEYTDNSEADEKLIRETEPYTAVSQLTVFKMLRSCYEKLGD